MSNNTSSPAIPPRPKRSDTAIIDEAALLLAKDVAPQLGEDPDEIFPDLRKAIESNSHNPDGYKLAKDLDYMGWTIDALLVDILDSASSYIHSAHDRACKEWATAHALQPPPIGAHVHQIGKEETNGLGTIVRNDESGKSTVCFPILGHNPQGPGTIGLVLPWEQLTIIHTP